MLFLSEAAFRQIVLSQQKEPNKDSVSQRISCELNIEDEDEEVSVAFRQAGGT